MRLSTLLTPILALLSFASAWTNPINTAGGADPFIVWTGGYYYLMTTTWNDVQMSRATTINGLKTAAKKVVYSTTTASRCCNVWAPEVHYFDGRWYIYYTAGNADNLDGQSIHVLRGGATPWDSFTYAAKLSNSWTIDASILRFNSYGNFLMTSCFNGNQYQSICLQKLGSDYVSVTGPVYTISQPTSSFETISHPVNEGPAALYFGGKTYIAYSASYCWSDKYCLGLLTWDGSTNPTSASAWKKSSKCVFSSGNGNYGTGHNAFFQSPDGKQTWNVYHATKNSAGACDNNRYTMVQLVGTHSDGSPNFGVPVDSAHVYSEPSGTVA